MARSMRVGTLIRPLYAPAVEAEKAFRACRERIAEGSRAAGGGGHFKSAAPRTTNPPSWARWPPARPRPRSLVALSTRRCWRPARRCARRGARVAVLRWTGRPDGLGRAGGGAFGATALVSAMLGKHRNGSALDVRASSWFWSEPGAGGEINLEACWAFEECLRRAGVDFYTAVGPQDARPQGVGALVAGPNER
jgi:hypothetical protein